MEVPLLALARINLADGEQEGRRNSTVAFYRGGNLLWN